MFRRQKSRLERLALANVYRYNGKELDEATGLYDYGARYYDPAVARWGQVDPLADQYASYSPYAYTLNNPIKYIDPDGMRVSLFDNMAAQVGMSDDGYQRMTGEYRSEKQKEGQGTNSQGEGEVLLHTSENVGTYQEFLGGGGRYRENPSNAQDFVDKVNGMLGLASRTSETNTIMTVIEIPYNYLYEEGFFNDGDIERYFNYTRKKIDALPDSPLKTVFDNMLSRYVGTSSLPRFGRYIDKTVGLYDFASNALTSLNIGAKRRVQLKIRRVPCDARGSMDCQATSHNPSIPIRVYYQFYGKVIRP